MVTVIPCRVASIISGQMAATRCTHTGTQPTRMKTSQPQSVCTWMWVEAGGELTVKLRCQEPSVTFPHQVSAALVKLENLITWCLMLRLLSCLSSFNVSLYFLLFLLMTCEDAQHFLLFFFSLSQAVNHLSHTMWCVPLHGWNLDKAVTTLNLWCRNLHLKSQESTADRKVGIHTVYFCVCVAFIWRAIISWLKIIK